MLTGLLDHCRMYSFSIIYAKQSLTLQPKKIIESSTSLSVLTSEKMGHRPQCRNTLTEHRNLLSSLAHLPDSKSCLSELLASDFPGLGNLDPALIWNKENMFKAFVYAGQQIDCIIYWFQNFKDARYPRSELNEQKQTVIYYHKQTSSETYDNTRIKLNI